MAQGFVVGLDIPVTQAVTLLSLSFEQLGSFWEGCNVVWGSTKNSSCKSVAQGPAP